MPLTLSVPTMSCQLSPSCFVACPSALHPHLYAGWKEGLQNISWEDLWKTYQRFHRANVKSYVHISTSQPLLEEEITKLCSLKSIVHYFVFDPMKWLSSPGDLSCDVWQSTIDYAKEHFGKYVGLRIVQEDLPGELLVPLLTKTAIFAKKPTLLFLEHKDFSLLRQVQDQLACHPLSREAASCIPIWKSSYFECSLRRYACIDFHAVDELLMQMKRPYCGGAVVEELEVCHNLSVSNLLMRALEKGMSVSSVLESWEAGFAWCPSRRQVIVALYTLVKALSTAASQEVQLAKNTLEKILEEQRIREFFCVDEAFLQFMEQTKALLLSADQVIASSRAGRRSYSWRD